MAEPTIGSMLAAMGSPIDYQAINTAKLSWDDATGRLGIGISTPNAALEVARGTGNSGTACFRGTTYACHFNSSTGETTYIRGGKVDSDVVIGDVNTSGVVYIGGVGTVVMTGTGGFYNGGAGDAAVWTRHIYGKDFASIAGDTLYINYGVAGKGVQIGDTGTDHPLYVNGRITSTELILSYGLYSTTATLNLYPTSGAAGYLGLTDDGTSVWTRLYGRLYGQLSYGGTSALEWNSSSEVYVYGNCSALSFTDRTVYPKDTKHAYDLLKTFEMIVKKDKDGNDYYGVDYDKLHPDLIKQDKHHGDTDKDEVIVETTVTGRDLSLTVSCLVEAMKDTSVRVEKLDKKSFADPNTWK